MRGSESAQGFQRMSAVGDDPRTCFKHSEHPPMMALLLALAAELRVGQRDQVMDKMNWAQLAFPHPIGEPGAVQTGMPGVKPEPPVALKPVTKMPRAPNGEGRQSSAEPHHAAFSVFSLYQ